MVEREAIGGQAGSSTLIRNYPGFSRGVSGAELAQRAYQQAWVFGAKLLLTRSVNGMQTLGRSPRGRDLRRQPRHRRARWCSPPACRYRRLGIPELEELSGAGVFYGASVSDAQALTGHEVYVVGGGNSAGQAAMHLRRYARRVFIVVRGKSLADSMSQYLRDTIAAHPDDIEVLHETAGGRRRRRGAAPAPRPAGTARDRSGRSMPRRCS